MIKPVKEFIDIVIGRENSDAELSVPAVIISVVTFPFRFIFKFIAFLLTSWASSRSGFAFVRGLPALCTAGVFIASLVVANFLLETRNVKRYEGFYAYELNKTEDANMASIYAEKLLGFYPDNPQYHYLLGTARYQAGDIEGAFDVMKYVGEKGLPVKNSDGDTVMTPFPPAVVWLAKTTASNIEREPNQEIRFQEAEEHYQRAIAILDTNDDEGLNDEDVIPYIETNIGLANIRSANGDIPGAIECLKNAVERPFATGQQIAAIPALLRLYRDNGQDEIAEILMKKNLKKLSDLARIQPDSTFIWAVVVQMCEVVEDYETAEATIAEAQQLASDDTVRKNIRSFMARIHLAKAEKIEEVSQFDPFNQRLVSASEAAMVNPRLPRPYEILNDLVWEQDREIYDQWLMKSLMVGGEKTGLNPAMTHLILGLRNLNSGRVSGCTTHWMIANQQHRLGQDLLNNLFEIEYRETIGELGVPETETPKPRHNAANRDAHIETLFDAISVAIETFPSQPSFYITRGKILMNRNKDQAAIEDFEIALKTRPNNLVLRELLAEAYTKIGDTERAELHQNEIERIEVKIAETKETLQRN